MLLTLRRYCSCPLQGLDALYAALHSVRPVLCLVHYVSSTDCSINFCVVAGLTSLPRKGIILMLLKPAFVFVQSRCNTKANIPSCCLTYGASVKATTCKLQSISTQPSCRKSSGLQVVAEFKTFREDLRPGRLMMLCLTPYVNKDAAMTSFAMATKVCHTHCPEAICIVVHGRGVNAILRDPRNPEYSCGQGMVMHEEDDTALQTLGRWGQRKQLKRYAFIICQARRAGNAVIAG